MSGRAKTVPEYVAGFASGALCQELPPDTSEAFRDGWADGRHIIREAVDSYLQSRGMESLKDMTVKDLLP